MPAHHLTLLPDLNNAFVAKWTTMFQDLVQGLTERVVAITTEKVDKSPKKI